MKKRRASRMSEKQAREGMRWPHATIGVPGGTKRRGGVMQANEHLGTGGGGIEDAMLRPPWMMRRPKKSKKQKR